jgi:hypothetical protein
VNTEPETTVLAQMVQRPALTSTERQGAIAPTLTGCPKLTDALAQARDRCKSASKDGENKHHQYRYASADEVVATASEALAGSGLALIFTKQEMSVMGQGQLAYYALHRVVFLSHASGEFAPLEIKGWPVIPDRGRPLDKAFAIALTSSLAYLLRDLLQMPRGTDSDVSAQDDRLTSPAPAPNDYQQGVGALTPTGPTLDEPPSPDYTAQARATVEVARQERYGGPGPNAQSAVASPTPLTITAEQRALLVGLIQQHKRSTEEVQAMLSSIELRKFENLPQSRAQWAMGILTYGQVQVPQVDRIAGLIEGRFSWEAINKKLQARYGVDRLRLLTARQADEIEAALLASPKPQPQP